MTQVIFKSRIFVNVNNSKYLIVRYLWLLASLMRNIFFRNRRRCTASYFVKIIMMFPLVLKPHPTLIWGSVSLYLRSPKSEGWLLLDIGWFVLCVQNAQQPELIRELSIFYCSPFNIDKVEEGPFWNNCGLGWMALKSENVFMHFSHVGNYIVVTSM